MKLKVTLISLVVLVMALAVSSVSAQDQPRRDDAVLRQVVQLVTTETGLSAQEVAQQVRDGNTLAQVISSNGGDVEAVIAEMTTLLTERITQASANGTITQERADTLLADLDTRLTNLLNGEVALGGGLREGLQERIGGQLLRNTLDSTSLNPAQLLQTLRDGATLAEAIEANGGSVETVIADGVAAITETVNEAVANERITQEQADNVLQDLEQRLTEAINGEANFARLLGQGIAGNLRNMDRTLRAVIGSVAEVSGLDALDVVAEVQGGSTLAEILTSNGVDLDSFVADATAPYAEQLAQAVENGRISQAVADARLNLRQVELTDLLNRTLGENLPATSS